LAARHRPARVAPQVWLLPPAAELLPVGVRRQRRLD